MGKFHLEERRAGITAVRGHWQLKWWGESGRWPGRADPDKRLPEKCLTGVCGRGRGGRGVGCLLSDFTDFINLSYPWIRLLTNPSGQTFYLKGKDIDHKLRRFGFVPSLSNCELSRVPRPLWNSGLLCVLCKMRLDLVVCKSSLCPKTFRFQAF